MEAYQVRMFKEYNELVDRYVKLNNFISKAEQGNLNFELNCPLKLLKEQSNIMWDYISILYERAKYEKIDLTECKYNG